MSNEVDEIGEVGWGEGDEVVDTAGDVEIDDGIDVGIDHGIDQAGFVDEFEVGGATDVAVDVERPASTGDPRVDDAIARLDDLDHAPTADHVTIVDDAHRRLQSALGDLDVSVHGGP